MSRSSPGGAQPYSPATISMSVPHTPSATPSTSSSPSAGSGSGTSMTAAEPCLSGTTVRACTSDLRWRDAPGKLSSMAQAAERGVMHATARRVLHDAPPAAGATVMATSIVSIALVHTGARGVSLALMWVAVIMWVGLAVAYANRAVHERSRLAAEAMQPAALTAAAGSCVLGSRLTEEGWPWAGYALLAVGVLVWVPLTPAVLIRRESHRSGSGFLL